MCKWKCKVGGEVVGNRKRRVQQLHDVNETQTYYQLGDEGPSYDAAQDVYRALTRNLGIEVTKMIPGSQISSSFAKISVFSARSSVTVSMSSSA